MWLGLYGRPKTLPSQGLTQFSTLEDAQEFVICSENEWTIQGPFPEYSEMKKHELWYDFYSDYWNQQVETICDSEIYLNFLDWLGENET